MRKKRVLVIGGLAAAGIVVAVICLAAATAADTALLPGITVEDAFPRGCVDCHKVSGGQDLRVNAMLRKIGEHPDVGSSMASLPGDCAQCHKKGGAAPMINLVMHRAHYKDAKGYFVTGYKGACLNCHALNQKTGEVGVKSGPKNW
jgi:hypothetical protein